MLCRPERRRFTLMAALVASAVVGQQLATVLHLATTEHRVCGEHGAWEHSEPGDSADARQSAGGASAWWAAAASSSEHEHEDCGVALGSASAIASHSPDTADALLTASELGRERSASASVALVHLAPKTSPPFLG